MKQLAYARFKVLFCIKHPLASLGYLFHVNRSRVTPVIRNEGATQLSKFINKNADARSLLHELGFSEIYEIINSALLEYPKADSSNMKLVKGPLLYVLIRALKPKIVLETGVASGVSTLFMLQALNYNNYGTLYSIDLPNVVEASEIPRGKQPGWIIPDCLKKRWELFLADSKRELPKLLNELGKIDIFLHDSLHTYEHMLWEFKTAWPYINRGGVLVSDDVNANPAFSEFTKNKNKLIILGLGFVKKTRNE